MEFEFIKTAFLTLFVAIDPPGLAAIFVALTAHMNKVERKATAIRAVTIAFCILMAAALGGQALLSMLGIGIPAFRIAGGMLLFWIAAEMIFERRQERKTHAAEEAIAHDHFTTIAAFPLAIPLMAGPGAITATILQSSNVGNDWIALGALIGILFVVLLICLLVFLMANPLDRLLGTTGRIVLTRLLGVLLAALAIQTVGDGIVAFIRHAAIA
ncbi:MAG: MarC family protein [Alphaproteobacteria bacterium]|nr:MarC family protein [Alphaproteobacteria bacterium]